MKLRSVCHVVFAAIGLVGCGASGSDGPGAEPADVGESGRRPPGQISDTPPTTVTVSGSLGEVTFIDVDGIAVTVASAKIEMINALQESVAKEGSTPLEVYLALADKGAAAPEFLQQDHQRRTARAPEAITLPTGAPSLQSQSLMSGYADTCNISNLTWTANVGVPSFWSQLAVQGPNPSPVSTLLFSIGTNESYMYLACATSGSSTADFFIKASSGSTWMHLPMTVSGNNVVYLIHATLWGDGLGEPGNPLDLWSSMSSSTNVNVLGRLGPAQP